MNKFNIFLLVIVMGSAFGIVILRDETRKNYIELEQSRKQTTNLNDEYARLVLEQINLSKHMVIEEQALKQGLHAPTVDEISVLEP